MKQVFTILWHYLSVKWQFPFSSRSVFLQWQDRKVQHFLRTIVPKSEFYTKLYQGYDLRDWKNLPIIDKTMMMEHFDHLNTVGIRKEEAFQIAFEAETYRDFSKSISDITIGLSSGTSGNRGIFIASKKERLQWAGVILGKLLPKSILHKQKIAFFLRADSQLYQSVRSNRIRFEFFDLLHPIAEHIQKLNHYKPTLLVAPPSMLRILAEQKQKGNLLIAPNKIISVAEVLDPLDEIYIKEQFQQIIHQAYQCTEGFLGATCKYGTLHLNEDFVAIQKEYLDKNSGKFIPIITDFSRTSQPIIRYRLNDILTERKTPCPCGSLHTALESIEGRTDDLFYIPSIQENKMISIFPDFIRRSIIMASDEIQEYQAVQLTPTQLTIYLRCPHEKQTEIHQKVSENLTQLFESLTCIPPDILFKEYTTPPPNGKKLKRILCLYSLDFIPSHKV